MSNNSDNRPKLTGHIENIYDLTDKIRCANDFIDDKLNRTLTMFRYNGLPDTIPEKELERILQVNGHGIVTDGSKGLLALWGGFAPPLNAYYRYTKLIVTNPWVEEDYKKEYTFGEDCVQIANDPNFVGMMPILHKYAVLTVEGNITLLNAIYAHRAMFMPVASDDNEKASIDLWLEQLKAGKLTSVRDSDKSMFGDGKGVTTQPYSQGSGNAITQIIELDQFIRGQFLNEIGINANYNMKRERLTEGETDLNKPALRPLVDAMLEERQKFCAEINKKYGTNITVEFNSSWAEYNEESETEEESSPIEVEDTNDETTTEQTPTEESSTEEPTTTEEVIEDVQETVEEIKEDVEEVLDEVKETKDEEADRSNAESDN